MAAWWLSETLETLRAQIDAAWPNRDHASDGTIGDASHSASVSDHNPDPTSNPPGVVRAMDVDTDLGDTGAMTRLADQLRREAPKDGRISYIIFAGHITSGTYPSQFWTWRIYNGDDPHTSHMHISVKPNGDHAGRPFKIPILEEETMPLTDHDVERIAAAVWATKIDDTTAGDDRKPRKASTLLSGIFDRVSGGK